MALIPRTSSPAHLREKLAAVELTVPEDEVRILDAIAD
jgi:aryl-alcohol dehydrogenase-like predicted oxidoreductase